MCNVLLFLLFLLFFDIIHLPTYQKKEPMPVSMSVKTTHPAYDTKLPTWTRARDCIEGQDAIHAAGTRYLPPLLDESDVAYNIRVTNALFFNASGRSVDALVGMLLRKPPSYDMPLVIPFGDDIDAGGTSIFCFTELVARELITVGRVGVLVDHPTAPPGMTLSDGYELGLRPTLSVWRAEDILSWRTTRINNRTILSFVVLQETQVSYDGFERKEELRYRVLDIEQETGHYRIRVFRVGKDGEYEQVGDDVFPVLQGQYMQEIPFHFFGGIDPQTPCLNDLFLTNLQHYKVAADFYNGLHMVGLPTPYITGWQKDPEESTKRIGGRDAWVFPDPETKVGFLEFTGSGLSNNVTAMEMLKKEMTVLGARMLEDQKRAVETAEVANIHRASENSILAAIAHQVSSGMTKCLQIFSDWLGGNEKVSFAVNTDFIPGMMSSQDLIALVNAWQSGALPTSVLAHRLVEGELTPAGMTKQDLEKTIKEPGFDGDFNELAK